MRHYYAFFTSPTGSKIVHSFRSKTERDRWVAWSECRRTATQRHPTVQEALRKGLVIEHVPGPLAKRRAQRYMTKRRTL